MLHISRPIAVECPYMIGSFNVQPLVHTYIAVPAQQKQSKSSLNSLFLKRVSAGKKGKDRVATCSSPPLVTSELEYIACSAPVIPQCDAFEAAADITHSDLFFYSPRTAPAPPAPSTPLPAMHHVVSKAIRAMKEWDTDLVEDSFWADV